MIKVTVELIPLGIGKPLHLGTLHLANDATGTRERGNYNGTLYGQRGDISSRIVRVQDWPRKSRPVWELVMEALHSAGYKHRTRCDEC